MVDISFTATDVVASTNTGHIQHGTAGGTIAGGQLIYQAADGDLEAAQADAATTDAILGVALNAAAAGQTVSYIGVNGTQVDFGGGVTLGEAYVLSAAAAGGIAPVADLTTNNYISLLGVGISSTAIMLAIANTGVQHA